MKGANPEEPDFYSFEKEWTEKHDHENYPVNPIYSPVEKCEQMYSKYYKEIKSAYQK
jgi:hypothetical protein